MAGIEASGREAVVKTKQCVTAAIWEEGQGRILEDDPGLTSGFHGLQSCCLAGAAQAEVRNCAGGCCREVCPRSSLRPLSPKQQFPIQLDTGSKCPVELNCADLCTWVSHQLLTGQPWLSWLFEGRRGSGRELLASPMVSEV